MKNYLNLAILTLGFSASAFATTSFCSSLTTFQDYISAGSCWVDPAKNYTVGDFTYVAVGVLSGVASASDINVTATVGAFGPTLDFAPDSGFKVTAGLVTADAAYLFGFDLVSADTNIGFSSVTLSETDNVSLLSTANVLEADCYGGALVGKNTILSLGGGGLLCTTGGVAVGANLAATALTSTNLSASIAFSGFANSVDVLKEVSLVSLGVGPIIPGFASVSDIGQSFVTENAQVGAATPEPASYFLGGCGLILVSLAKLTRKTRDARK
jgi:hypothetical protein